MEEFKLFFKNKKPRQIQSQIAFFELAMNFGDQQTLKYINLAREYPTYFVSLIDNQLDKFINDKDLAITGDIIYETQEGKTLWIQTREFLIKQQPLPGFKYHRGLSRAAQDHIIDLCQNNQFGHKGSDNSVFSERILRYCKKARGAMAEIIGADFHQNPSNHAEMTVLSLIIDDGVYQRGHRKTIFNPQYKYVGLKSGLQGDKIITVFNLTQNNYRIIQENMRIPVTQHNVLLSKSIDQKLLKSDYYQINPTQNQKRHQIQNSRQRENRTPSPSFRYQSQQKIMKDISHLKNNTHNSPFKAAQHDFYSKLNNTCGYPFNAGMGTNNFNSPNKDYSRSSGSNFAKKLIEKIENTTTIYEDGSKVVEKLTRLIYQDGTIDQNIQRHTYYQ